MYAVVEIYGKQYRADVGSTLSVDRFDAEKGKGEKDEKSKLEKELFSEHKNAWEILGEEKKAAFRFSEDYRDFLDKNKTEREIVS
ncbi:MAG: bL21 family ribosomal protein, partial [Spirochaetota bacterium]